MPSKPVWPATRLEGINRFKIRIISVLEASDVDNLLDQFESADFGGIDDDDNDFDNEDDFDDLDDPETVSTIWAAVHNHFVASDTSGIKKKSPRIGTIIKNTKITRLAEFMLKIV